MSLQALTVVEISGVTSFTASADHFYRVDTSVGNVTVTLPQVSTLDSTAWMIVKKISSDANVVNVTPGGTDQMDASSSPNVLTSHNQSHMYMPGTPSFYGTGWVSW